MPVCASIMQDQRELPRGWDGWRNSSIVAAEMHMLNVLLCDRPVCVALRGRVKGACAEAG